MPYGLNPYGGYTGLRIPQDNNMLGAGPVGAGPAPGMGVDPGVANLQAPAGALTPQMGAAASSGLTGPLAGFAMNMFMQEMNKSHQMSMVTPHPLGLRPPQQQMIQAPALYHPIAIGRPYG